MFLWEEVLWEVVCNHIVEDKKYNLETGLQGFDFILFNAY